MNRFEVGRRVVLGLMSLRWICFVSRLGLFGLSGFDPGSRSQVPPADGMEPLTGLVACVGGRGGGGG